MQESHRIELKSRLTDDLEKEVVAFFCKLACFLFTENFLRMTFRSAIKSERITPQVTPQDELVEGLVERLVEGLVENQKKIVILINKNPAIKIKELSKAIGISTTAIDKNIIKLKDKNINVTPFVIGLGLDLSYLEKFKCIGSFQEAETKDAFKNVLKSTFSSPVLKYVELTGDNPLESQ
jgi:hypothetical protein